jgi:dienelactone hydrolase
MKVLATIFAAGLMASASAFGAGEATHVQYPIVEKDHIYYDGETELHGYLLYQDRPDVDSRPGLLVFPYFMAEPALQEREVGYTYAERGMVVFVADYYGEIYSAEDPEQIGAVLGGLYPSLTKDWETMRRLALLSLEQLTSVDRVDADRVGVLGFCMGGMMAGELARAGGKSLVSISLHGLVHMADSDGNAREGETEPEPYDVGYFAAFFGANDPLISSSMVEASRAFLERSTTVDVKDSSELVAHLGGASIENDYEVTEYGNTAHAFSFAMSDTILQFLADIGFEGAAAYNAKRAKSAFNRVDDLFVEYGLLEEEQH